jgi:subtilase family serine protease
MRRSRTQELRRILIPVAPLCAVLVASCAGGGTTPPTSQAGLQSELRTTSAVGNLRSVSHDGAVASAPGYQGITVKDLGRASNAVPLPLAVTLRYRDEPKLGELISEQETPSSPKYRRWLTNDQFNAQFAPTQASYLLVLHSLEKAGFRIDGTYPNRTVIDATGTVASIERYFRTTIHRVDQKGYGIRYVNATPATVSAGLRPIVLAVDGLNTLQVVKTDYAVARRPGSPVRRSAHSHGWPYFGPPGICSGCNYYTGYGPAALSTAYDMPVKHLNSSGHPYDGTGRASGIVISADPNQSDLDGFLAYFKISHSAPVTRVKVDGGASGEPDSTALVEATLDAETILGQAPNTHLYIYEMPQLNAKDITDAYNKVATDNVVDAVNSSFGAYEVDAGNTGSAWNAIAEQGAAKGIVFHASSGDNGGYLGTNLPDGCPYFTAVGGTTLSIGAKGIWDSEFGWSGSGGGVSLTFPEPSYQAHTPGLDTRGRNVPDVAFDADPYTGVAFYFDGTWNNAWNPLGGTSLASPIFDALVTEIDQVKGGRVGFGAATVYHQYDAFGVNFNNNAIFHDITQGSNGLYFAGPGYDLVTGIGSVDAWNQGASL